MVADVCTKSEARNVVSLHCDKTEHCETICPGCGCVCINHLCQKCNSVFQQQPLPWKTLNSWRIFQELIWIIKYYQCMPIH